MRSLKNLLFGALSMAMPAAGNSQIEGYWKGNCKFHLYGSEVIESDLSCIIKKQENSDVYYMRCREKVKERYEVKFSYNLVKSENEFYTIKNSAFNIYIDGIKMPKSAVGLISNAVCFPGLNGKIQKEKEGSHLKLICPQGHEWNLYQNVHSETKPKEAETQESKPIQTATPCLDGKIPPVRIDTIHAGKNSDLSIKIQDFQQKDDDRIILFVNKSKTLHNQKLNEEIELPLSSEKNIYDIIWCSESTGEYGKNTGKIEIYQSNKLIYSRNIVLELNQRYRLLIIKDK